MHIRTKEARRFFYQNWFILFNVSMFLFGEERICNMCNVLWTVEKLLYIIYFCKLTSCHEYHVIYCALCMATVLNVKSTNCYLSYKEVILSHCRTTETPNIKAGFHVVFFILFPLYIVVKTSSEQLGRNWLIICGVWSIQYLTGVHPSQFCKYFI